MANIAVASAPAHFAIEATTSTRSVPLITNAAALANAASLVVQMFDEGLDPLDGVIISAFGDPGVETLRERLTVPVVGIAEAALREAAAIGPFGVCTTTPDLTQSIRNQSARLGLSGLLRTVRATRGDPADLMSDPQRLDAALAGLIEHCIDDDGVLAIVIGGGPLAASAKRLAPEARIPLIDPVSAGVRCFRSPQ